MDGCITHPEVWKRVKDDWEDRFSRLPIDIQVKVRIQEFGAKGTKRG
ncbi:Ger(x)C family spore germination C-terminal domain-containing protein [Paenibacillus rigui]